MHVTRASSGLVAHASDKLYGLNKVRGSLARECGWFCTVSLLRTKARGCKQAH